MSKLDKKQMGKVNTIAFEIEGFMYEFDATLANDKSAMLSCISAIICQFDTDIAIEVMKKFGKEGENQAMAIKVNYGY